MNTLPLRTTWIEVDAGALANNVRKLRRRLTPGTRLMGVVKANAYGHGAIETARVVVRAGADWLAVATFTEAMELRGAGIDVPLLVLGYTAPHLALDAARHDISLTWFDAADADAMAAVAQPGGAPLKLHLKINTGMNRLGCEPAEAAAILEAARALPNVAVEGIFTHFATSDELDQQHARRQFHLFEEILEYLSEQGLRPPLAHAANSAALLTMPETHLDMARSGIALYGLDPDAVECTLPDGFRPALTWKAQVAQVRWIGPGDAVSYGREFIADRRMLTAVLPIGYADGFPRRPRTWDYVLVGGQPAPILGRVCMDQTVVDVSAAILVNGAVSPGDEAVIIGRQGDRHITAEEAAARVGTNTYDFFSRFFPRYPGSLRAPLP